MNSAANTSSLPSQQSYGSGLSPNASPSGASYSSTNSTPAKDEVKLSGSNTEQSDQSDQDGAPKKKHTVAKVIGGIVAALGMIGLGCLVHQAVLEKNIKEQIGIFDAKEEGVVKTILDKFKVSKGQIEAKDLKKEEIAHPRQYGSMLEEFLQVDKPETYLQSKGVKSESGHKQALLKWHSDNHLIYKPAEE